MLTKCSLFYILPVTGPEVLNTTTPIKLQDPPKTKLKRQLSVDTADRTEALRVKKKVALVSESLHDEVDGDCDVIHDVIINKSSHVTASVPIACKQRNLSDRPLPLETHEGVRVPDMTDRRHPAETLGGVRIPDMTDRRPPAELNAGISEISNSYDDSEYGCLSSPGNFNMSDICLTSPFTSTASSNTKLGEKNIFVFPDSVPPRKPSPYKLTHEEYPDRDVHESRGEFTREYGNRLVSQSSYKNDQEEPNCGKSRTGSSAHAHTSYKPLSKKSHVTDRGFIWPEKVTIPDTMPLSPRIAPSESVGRMSSPSNERLTRQEQQTLNNRLRMLERERDRAKEIYKCAANELSPNARVFESVRRGISHQDRSPNEKEIREISEEVRRQYSRSFSDPRCSPRQHRNRVSKPSPLLDQADNNSQDSKVSVTEVD